MAGVLWVAQRDLVCAALHSATRHWLPSDGCEWLRLQGVTFSAAFHVLRLLAHGLLGLPGARTRRERLQLPRSCQQCHGPEIAWVSYTPTDGHPGAALCWGCAVQPVPPPGSAAWRLALPNTFGMSRAGGYPACPLCGRGEAGGERLSLSCASVQQAWHDLTARSDTKLPTCTARCATRRPSRSMSLRDGSSAPHLPTAGQRTPRKVVAMTE